MKIIIFCIGYFLINNCLYSQEITNDFKTLIDSAIHIKCSQILAADNVDKEYLKKIYIVNENGQSMMLSKGNKLNTLNIYDRKNKHILKKGLHIWKVVTILEKNKFIINIIDFQVTYKRNNYDFANGGGTKIIFEFSCDENNWKLIYNKTQGI